MIYIVQHRRGTTEQWQQSDIIPDDGEIVIEKCADNTSKIKIGDGKNTFADLPPFTLDIDQVVPNLLPPVDTASEGNVLKVVNGKAAWAAAIKEYTGAVIVKYDGAISVE